MSDNKPVFGNPEPDHWVSFSMNISIKTRKGAKKPTGVTGASFSFAKNKPGTYSGQMISVAQTLYEWGWAQILGKEQMLEEVDKMLVIFAKLRENIANTPNEE